MPMPWEVDWASQPGQTESTDSALQKASTAAITTNGVMRQGGMTPAQEQLASQAFGDVIGERLDAPPPGSEAYRGWGESIGEMMAGLGSTIHAATGIIPGMKGAKEVASMILGKDADEGIRHLIAAGRGADFGYESQAPTWEEAKADPLRKGLPWAAETGIQSIPEMAGAMLAPGAYLPAKAGMIAEQRAQAEGLEQPGLQERAIGAAAAPAIMAMERFGGRGMLGMGKELVPGATGRMMYAGAKEGATEYPQEALEYTAETPTDQFSLEQMNQRGLQGMAAGTAMGTTVRGLTEAGQQQADAAPRQGPPGPPGAGDPEAGVPTQDATIAALLAQKAQNLGGRRVLGPTAPVPQGMQAQPSPLGGMASGAQSMDMAPTGLGRRVLGPEQPQAQARALLPELAADPLVSMPDGSVARQSEVEALMQQADIPQRAQMMGMGQQPATIAQPEAVQELPVEEIEAAPAPTDLALDLPTVSGERDIEQIEAAPAPVEAVEEIEAAPPPGAKKGEQVQMRTAGIDPTDPMTAKMLKLMEQGGIVEDVEMEGAAEERGTGRESVMMDPAEVLQYATNVPRKTRAEYQPLISSMKKEGFRKGEPLVMKRVGDRLELSEGHHRAAVAKGLKMKEVPVTILEQGAEGKTTPYTAKAWGAKAAAEPTGSKKKTPSKTSTGSATKLYSNPLDPDLLSEAFGGVKQAWKKRTQAWKEDLDITRSNFQGSKGHLPVWRAAARTVRVLVQSNDSYIRGLAKAYKSPELLKIANKLHAPVGQESTGQDYESAVDQRTMTNLNKLGKIMEPIGRDQAALKALADELKSGNHQSDAAKALAKLLKSEHEYQVAAGANLGQVTNYYPHDYQADKVMGDPVKFMAQATKLYARTFPDLKPEEHVQLAEEWRENIILGDLGVKTSGSDFVAVSGTNPVPSHHKKATFKRSDAEALMGDFMNQNPVDVLNTYFVKSARRAEWERRFGGDQWAQHKAKILEEGAYGALDHVVKAIQSSTGSLPNNISRGTSDMLSWVRVLNALAYLPRATISSLNELVMPAVRTGDVRVLARGMMDSIVNLRRKYRDKELAEIADEVLGITGKVATDMLMNQRFGGNVDRKAAQHMTSKFFYNTGLHGLTEGQRMASLSVGDWFIRKLAQDVKDSTSRQKSAEILLKELGVSNPKAFADAIVDAPRTADQYKQNNAQMAEMRTALQRFVDGSIMSPKASERPRFASHPLGGLAYQLTSFIYSFTKAVIERNARLAKRAVTDSELTAADRLRLGAPALSMTLLLIISMGVSELRDEVLFKDPNRKPRSPRDKFLTALSRSGLVGTADIALNFVTGLKYSRDPATFALGPTLGGLSQLITSSFNLLTDRNSENTVNAERNAAKSWYTMVVNPALNAAATLSPSTGLGAAAIQAFSHPEAKNLFMDLTAGEKETKTTVGRTRRTRRKSRRSRRKTTR